MLLASEASIIDECRPLTRGRSCTDTMPDTQPVHTAPRPLIVRIRNFIGDVVLGIPALERLEQAGYELHLVGKPWAKSLLEAYGWQVARYPKSFAERRALLVEIALPLRARDPTFSKRVNAVTFATSFSSALDMRSAGLRPFGYAVEGRSFLLKKTAPIVYGEHALDSYWRLTSALLNDNAPNPQAVQLKVSQQAHHAARAALRSAGVRSGYIVLVPFAGGTFELLDKKWPLFAQLAARVASTGRDVVMAPGPDEMDAARAIYPLAKLLPKLELGPYSAVLRDAALTIANDTGPGHIAASVGGRLLSVLGPTKIEQWGPRGPHVTVVQSYPEWPSVDAVADAASRLLKA